jgi:signal transduction histidine kinase/ActR/RegA family two-component response regulator
MSQALTTVRNSAAQTAPQRVITPLERLLYGHYAGDRLQRVRMLRYYIAAISSLLVIGLVVIGWLLDFVPAFEATIAGALIMTCIAVFLALFRSGLNLKFRDPSLTLPQILASVATISFFIYHAGESSTIYFLIYMVAFLFGVFHYTTGPLMLLALVVVAAYCAVVGLRMTYHPETINLNLEILRVIVLGLVLGWFALMGGYITNLRNRLREARDKAEAASRAKSEFLANMSHEIRTPIHGVMGMTELTLNTELTAQQRQYLTTIMNSSRNLLTILSDILDLAKVEARQLAIEPVPFQLRGVIDRTLAPLVPEAVTKNLRLDVSVAPDLPASICADPVRIGQILMNLVNNAIKFTDKGGVTVTLERGAPSGDGFMLQIVVRDSGIGIPTDKQQAIFDAFSQADMSTTRVYGGSGLGLTICSRLATLMGGGISVSSKPGAGSTFRASLRVGVAAADGDTGAATPAAVVPADAAPGTAAGMHALLAEDNPVNLAVAEAMLLRLGYRVTIVGNGREAIAQARATRFDAILMDIQMPDIGGLDATRAIRDSERETGWRTPIVAFTASAMQGDRERCLAAGMDAYLAKPFELDQLARELQAVTRSVPRHNAF